MAVDGGWGQWTTWSTCSVACGDGQETRSRFCNDPAPSNGGQDCSGVSEESRSCNDGDCPVNGAWTDWSNWGDCSVTCGSGERARSRSCTDPRPANSGNDCSGQDQETESCTAGNCPGRHCVDLEISDFFLMKDIPRYSRAGLALKQWWYRSC